jgi:D-alanine-D-alanine ligase
MKVGITCDLRKAYLAEGYTEEQVAEFDSDATLDALESTIRELGHETDRIGHGRALCERLVRGDRWDLVFNICEGLRGRSREAQVPALLEMYGIPCTFSDPLVCALTLDKAMSKRVIQWAGLRTPAFALIEKEEDLAGLRLHFPLFAKPVAEGTGKGVDSKSRIDSARVLTPVVAALLRRFAQPVLLEEYLPGREFTVGILGTGPRAAVLGTIEVCIRGDAPAQDYSYEVKELCEKFVKYLPVEPGPLKTAVESLALASYRALECRDAGRVDIRLDAGDNPSFMEVNPLPGLHPSHSDLPIIATQEGMDYRTLIGTILNSAGERLRRGT